MVVGDSCLVLVLVGIGTPPASPTSPAAASATAATPDVLTLASAGIVVFRLVPPRPQAHDQVGLLCNEALCLLCVADLPRTLLGEQQQSISVSSATSEGAPQPKADAACPYTFSLMPVFLLAVDVCQVTNSQQHQWRAATQDVAARTSHAPALLEVPHLFVVVHLAVQEVDRLAASLVLPAWRQWCSGRRRGRLG